MDTRVFLSHRLRCMWTLGSVSAAQSNTSSKQSSESPMGSQPSPGCRREDGAQIAAQAAEQALLEVEAAEQAAEAAAAVAAATDAADAAEA